MISCVCVATADETALVVLVIEKRFLCDNTALVMDAKKFVNSGVNRTPESSRLIAVNSDPIFVCLHSSFDV